jgi:predicted transcriptional regulator YdeE
VNSLAEAIDWVKRCPNPMPEESEIEIRPIFEADDFGETFTPELREQEAVVRALSLGLERPTFQDLPARWIVGLNRTYTMETRAGIPAQWSQFVPRFADIANRVGTDSYGVCWNFRPDCGFDYLTGVEVSSPRSLASDLASLELKPCRYAVFPHTGHISSIAATIDTIWSKWVKSCGLKTAETPCFERYTAEFDPVAGRGGTEIWVPIAS